MKKTIINSIVMLSAVSVLACCSLMDSDFDVLSLSSEDDFGQYYFIFNNNDIVAKIRVNTDENGEFYSNYTYDVESELQNLYESSRKVSVVIEENEIKVVEGYTYGLIGSVIEKEREIKYETVNCGKQRSVSFGKKTLNVSFVPNQKVNDRYVLCWAACIAMVVNYMSGKKLSAYDVYENIDSPSEARGTKNNIINAYKKYGYTATRLDYSLTPNEVYQSLVSDKPVQIYVADAKKSLYHEMLICGVHVYNDKTCYSFYDPSVLGGGIKMVTVYCNPSQNGTFTYPVQYIDSTSGNITNYTLTWTKTTKI